VQLAVRYPNLLGSAVRRRSVAPVAGCLGACGIFSWVTLAALRAIHNLTIVVPADNFESREAIKAAAKSDSPMFIRFGKAAMYNLHRPDAKFEVGRAIQLRDGKDVAFRSSSATRHQANGLPTSSLPFADLSTTSQ